LSRAEKYRHPKPKGSALKSFANLPRDQWNGVRVKSVALDTVDSDGVLRPVEVDTLALNDQSHPPL